MRPTFARLSAFVVVLVVATSSTVSTQASSALRGAEDEHGMCELCMYTIHQVQYGSIPPCGGTGKENSFSSCSQVVQSILTFAGDVMHLISTGCYKYSAYSGWQTLKPCPAHVVCGRVFNVFDSTHPKFCPTDYHYKMPPEIHFKFDESRKNALVEFAKRIGHEFEEESLRAELAKQAAHDPVTAAVPGMEGVGVSG